MQLRGPIKDFAVGIYDGPHATPADADDGPIFLGIKNVTPDGRLDFSEIKHVSENEFPKWTRRVVPQADDVVFTYEATLHRYALIPEGFRGCLGRRMALVRPDKKKVNPQFLHYYFLSPRWRALVESNVITGATVDRIPIARFPDFEVVLPELGVQKKIAAVISSYDDLIENNRRRMQLLEQSARLLYKEWFVHLRFPGHEHVKVVDGVPNGWSQVPLGQSVVLNYGKALRADQRIDGPYPVFGSSGIVGTHETPMVKGPAIILGRKGNVGSVFWSPKDCWPIDTVYFIDSKRSDLFLYYALQQLQFISTDVAVPGLNRSLAYSRSLLMPRSALITEFLDYVDPIHEQIMKLGEVNAKLVAARDLLLPRLMCGEIEV